MFTAKHSPNYRQAVAASRAIHKERRSAFSLADSLASPRKVEPPTADQIRAREALRPVGYYRLFCVHHRAMWQPCSSQTCRRGKEEAVRNWERLCRGEL